MWLVLWSLSIKAVILLTADTLTVRRQYGNSAGTSEGGKALVWETLTGQRVDKWDRLLLFPIATHNLPLSLFYQSRSIVMCTQEGRSGKHTRRVSACNHDRTLGPISRIT